MISLVEVANFWYSSRQIPEEIEVHIDPAELPPLYYPIPESCLDDSGYEEERVNILTK